MTATDPCPPADAIDAADLRTCDAGEEISRCLRILAWLEAIPIPDLLRTAPPVANDELISVVVPMYNASRWIDLCLKGLLAQTHSNQEIFCVDDCSDDDTYERVVERFGRDERICAIKLGKTVGPYQIKNWVIASLARGARIALQDADDVSHPLRLAAQQRCMDANGYRVSGTCAHQFFPPGISLPLGIGAPVDVDGVLHNLAYFPTVERTMEPVTAPRSHERAGAGFWETCRTGPYKVYSHVLADHGTQMLERSLFLEFGGFDGGTKVAADSDFNARVVRFHAIGNLPRIMYSRRFHALSLTQHPMTGLNSVARRDYRSKRALREAKIRSELAAGRIAGARALCTADLYFGDVEVRQMHSGFAVAESPPHRPSDAHRP